MHSPCKITLLLHSSHHHHHHHHRRHHHCHHHSDDLDDNDDDANGDDQAGVDFAALSFGRAAIQQLEQVNRTPIFCKNFLSWLQSSFQYFSRLDSSFIRISSWLDSCFQYFSRLDFSFIKISSRLDICFLKILEVSNFQVTRTR